MSKNTLTRQVHLLSVLLAGIALSACSGGTDGPKTDADLNAKIDKDIADIQARKDLTPEAKANITRLMNGGRKAPDKAPPLPERKSSGP